MTNFEQVDPQLVRLSKSDGSSLIGFIQSGTGAVSRTVQDKQRDHVSVKDFGAVGDGVTNNSAIFSAITNQQILVPAGTYYLATDVTSSTVFVFDSGAALNGPGYLYAPINRPANVQYPARKYNLGDVMAKINAGTPITIAMYGTSITYSQDTTASGTNPAINGATQTRSANPIDVSFNSALGFAGVVGGAGGGLSVINRGFPGDTTIEGITRWANASATDVSFIEYGHNDANNYGGYAHGPVPIASYRRNLALIIEREIIKGAAVVVVGSTNVLAMQNNENIRAYAHAARTIADEYGVPFVDWAEILSTKNYLWVDGVHLDTYAYNEIGWHLASLFARRDGAIRRVSAGDIFYATDAIGHGGALFGWAPAKASDGYLISLAQNQTYSIGVYVEEDCLPVIHTVNATASIFTLNAYYAGGLTATSGLPSSGIAHDQTKGTRQKFVGPILRRGYRTLFIRNDTATAITGYIEAIEFRSAGSGATTVSRGLVTKSAAMSGVFQPSRISTSLLWFTALDTSRRITDPCSIIAWMTLTDVGTNAYNGICISQYAQQSTAADTLSSNMLMVLRSGTGLVLRQLINGNPDTDTTIAGVFAAGSWTGEIEVDLSAGLLSVYVNGTLAGSRTVAQTYGFPGVIGSSAARLVCYSMFFNGEVKSVY